MGSSFSLQTHLLPLPLVHSPPGSLAGSLGLEGFARALLCLVCFALKYSSVSHSYFIRVVAQCYLLQSLCLIPCFMFNQNVYHCLTLSVSVCLATSHVNSQGVRTSSHSPYIYPECPAHGRNSANIYIIELNLCHIVKLAMYVQRTEMWKKPYNKSLVWGKHTICGKENRIWASGGSRYV